MIVVSHNSGQDLLRLAEQVVPQAALRVADNASTDGVIDQLPASVSVSRLGRNVGFGAACNHAAAKATTEFLLFLNPDTDIPSDLIARFEQAADAHGEFALFGCRVVNADGSVQAATYRRLPTFGPAFRRALGGRWSEAEVGGDPVRSVDAINGSVMMIRTGSFNRLAGFDEAFFLHCEDLDLFARVTEGHEQIGLLDDLTVVHRQGGSDRHRWFVEYHKHRGLVRYFRKHMAATHPRWLRGLVPLGIWLRYSVLLPWWAVKGLLRRH